MPNVVPLIQVPLNAFMKAFDINSSKLEHLRRSRAKRVDGFFLFRDVNNCRDGFPLLGKYAGNWRLGRISLTQNDPVYDYRVEVYRRSLNMKEEVGTVLINHAKDDGDLADLLRELNTGKNITHNPSPWNIAISNTFTKFDFEIQ